MSDEKTTKELNEAELDQVQGAGFQPNFSGGVRVASGDVNGDGGASLIGHELTHVAQGKSTKAGDKGFHSTGSGIPTV